MASSTSSCFNPRCGNCASTGSSSSGGCPSAEKVLLLEAQLNSLRQQLNVLIVEMGLAHEWIQKAFGAQIINTDSPHFKSVHVPSFEAQAIKKSLEMKVAEAVTEGGLDSEENSTGDGDGARKVHSYLPKSSFDAAVKRNENETVPEPTTANSNPTTEEVHIPNANANPNRSRSLCAGQTATSTSNPASTLAPTTAVSEALVGQLNPNPNHSRQRKRYKCQYCQVQFASAYDTRRHERIHTGEKPYKCRFCPASFTQSNQQRNRHERFRHTGEKPYKCRFCPTSFADHSGRNTHEQTHTDEKPFVCQYCDKRFKRKENLGNHVRTHTNEKPYVCQSCGEEFHKGAALRLHKRTTHTVD